jgi:cysteinyl-tRNA synthetase
MTLRIYNTLTRRKQDFTPLEAGKVKMYVCGVTVYDYCHLGHARAYVVWDMVRRYLRSRDYEVQYVQNFTDIDDKILKRAQAEGVTMQAIAERYIQAYSEDMDKLNILPADQYPRATESIPAILNLIQSLIDRGYAYASGGDVYYAVRQFPNYGKLSGRKLEDMQSGASGRVDETEPLKQYPFDFALWKAAKTGEPFWESPWGNGRPGWHIECSAMVQETFGDRIDIHSGGADLQFPHHENEIAQSEAVTEQPLANFWMHNGFVNIENESGEVEKMSKSLNNFKTIRDLLEVYEPMVIRLFILQSQYRQPISFTEDAIAATRKGWETIREGLLFANDFPEKISPETQPESEIINRFNAAMDDDFNTSVALSHVFEQAKSLASERNILIHSGKTETSPTQLRQTWQNLTYMANVLGLEALALKSYSATAIETITEEQIEKFIQERSEAKKAKNWQESDRIRSYLQTKEIKLIDQPDGTTRWICETPNSG